MSPRAACRLATLGFERVHDFMPGKVDWMARALPVQGTKATTPRAIDYARHDIITVRPDAQIATVRARLDASPYGFALITTDDGVLLGRLRQTALEHSDGQASELMEPGPSTTRPDAPPEQLRERLHDRRLSTAVLTDPDGRLLGIVRRADLDPD